MYEPDQVKDFRFTSVSDSTTLVGKKFMSFIKISWLMWRERRNIALTIFGYKVKNSLLPWILWHVNPLSNNARNTHMANNTASVFSLCLCSLGMRNYITKQCLEITWDVFSAGPARAQMDWLDSDHFMCFL